MISFSIFGTISYEVTMFIFGKNHKDKILSKFEKMKSRGNKNQNALQHASMRENGTLYFDIKKIKDAHR